MEGTGLQLLAGRERCASYKVNKRGGGLGSRRSSQILCFVRVPSLVSLIGPCSGSYVVPSATYHSYCPLQTLCHLGPIPEGVLTQTPEYKSRRLVSKSRNGF